MAQEKSATYSSDDADEVFNRETAEGGDGTRPNARDEEHDSFGFRRVKKGEKEKLVRGVFDAVAPHYDLMNDLMSGGVHRVWKSVLIDRLNPQPGRTVLDMAGGTGDVAEAYLKRATTRPHSDGAMAPANAVICDINFEMLNAGADRALSAKNIHDLGVSKLEDQITRICADAAIIPLPDQCVDAYTISFGIRNVVRLDEALSEAYRVLRYGGMFACLEFSHPMTEGLQKIYDAYSFNVIPWLGEHVVNDRESYQYLVESIRRFPSQESFAEKIRRAGFRRVRYENLTGGVAALHLGWRI